MKFKKIPIRVLLFSLFVALAAVVENRLCSEVKEMKFERDDLNLFNFILLILTINKCHSAFYKMFAVHHLKIKFNKEKHIYPCVK